MESERIVDGKILTLISHTPRNKTVPTLKDQNSLDYLEQFHSKFVVTPIDKAANNVAIICKRFYINAILDELGIPDNSSATYRISTLQSEQIVNINNELCKKFTKKELEDPQKILPVIYWIPKMHYSPCRKRFIIASSNCSTKPLSQLASKAFKHKK